ncbi:MAG: 4Fe-4S binding protein [Saprospiraceae bacterium]
MTSILKWSQWLFNFEVKNEGVWFKSLSNRGVVGWILALFLTIGYITLYFFPAWLGLGAKGMPNTGFIAWFDPISRFFNGSVASQWFVYGFLYTLIILVMGVKFIIKYKNNNYQIIRTISLLFFQLCFAFIIPEIMASLNQPAMDLKNMWPLNYYFFFDWNIKKLLSSGYFGLFLMVWGIALTFIISPVLTYFYGKRWYCSWVCGCGGLAETAGDPFRHLSDNSETAWKWERRIIYPVLFLVCLMTLTILDSFFRKNPETYWITFSHFKVIILLLLAGIIALGIWQKGWLKGVSKWSKIGFISLGIILFIAIAFSWSYQKPVLLINALKLREWYGFYVGAIFSGIIGVGFYPLMGSRVWCRFGCPMAAILGIQQRFFSRFRITVNGGQCISCGNCSTYCEMGIDVRAYAQKGENIVRASCVGCGICAEVCPRGVLKLENGPLSLENGKIKF